MGHSILYNKKSPNPPDEKLKILFNAIEKGDQLRDVDLAEINDISWKNPDKNGDTLLHAAVRGGIIENVTNILKHESKNIKNYNDETPIKIATKCIFVLSTNRKEISEEYFRYLEILQKLKDKFINSSEVQGEEAIILDNFLSLGGGDMPAQDGYDLEFTILAKIQLLFEADESVTIWRIYTNSENIKAVDDILIYYIKDDNACMILAQLKKSGKIIIPEFIKFSKTELKKELKKSDNAFNSLWPFAKAFNMHEQFIGYKKNIEKVEIGEYEHVIYTTAKINDEIEKENLDHQLSIENHVVASDPNRCIKLTEQFFDDHYKEQPEPESKKFVKNFIIFYEQKDANGLIDDMIQYFKKIGFEPNDAKYLTGETVKNAKFYWRYGLEQSLNYTISLRKSAEDTLRKLNGKTFEMSNDKVKVLQIKCNENLENSAIVLKLLNEKLNIEKDDIRCVFYDTVGKIIYVKFQNTNRILENIQQNTIAMENYQVQICKTEIDCEEVTLENTNNEVIDIGVINQTMARFGKVCRLKILKNENHISGVKLLMDLSWDHNDIPTVYNMNMTSNVQNRKYYMTTKFVPSQNFH